MKYNKTSYIHFPYTDIDAANTILSIWFDQIA